MDFKTAMEHYKSGTASKSERELVESELEKNRLISEYLDASWNDAPQTPEFTPETPIKVTALLKRHDRKTILKGLALLAALVLLVTCVILPLAERLYWNPDDTSFGDSEFDVKLAMDAYTELFLPCKTLSGFHVHDTGFADYELTFSIHDRSKPDWYHLTAYLRKGELLLGEGFFEDDPRWVHPFREMEDFVEAEDLNLLKTLPEYVTLRAAVTFPEDMDMAQIFGLWTGYTWSNAEFPLTIDWVAVRHSDEDLDKMQLPCGFNFANPGLDTGINQVYPQFYNWGLNPDGSDLEQHFKSLLQFSSDGCRSGRVVFSTSQSYYDNALAYVEENGVMSYGCIVTGSPDALQNLLDQGIADQIRILDGWLDVS